MARCLGRLRAALSDLANAHAYSIDLGVDLWTFAVEIQAVRACGLTDNDLRWLVCKGYVDHAGETTPLGQDERSFRHTGRFKFCRKTCFVLTEAGVRFFHAAAAGGHNGTAAIGERPGPGPGPGPAGRVEVDRDRTNGHADPLRPHWDADRQELRLGRTVVKQFKVPASNQELVLSAFQEEGWPFRIDDPIPPHQDIDPKRRLHDTINSLNRCQKAPLLRFLGDGSGKGVRWESVATSRAAPPERLNGSRYGAEAGDR